MVSQNLRRKIAEDIFEQTKRLSPKVLGKHIARKTPSACTRKTEDHAVTVVCCGADVEYEYCVCVNGNWTIIDVNDPPANVTAFSWCAWASLVGQLAEVYAK